MSVISSKERNGAIKLTRPCAGRCVAAFAWSESFACVDDVFVWAGTKLVRFVCAGKGFVSLVCAGGEVFSASFNKRSVSAKLSPLRYA